MEASSAIESSDSCLDLLKSYFRNATQLATVQLIATANLQEFKRPNAEAVKVKSSLVVQPQSVNSYSFPWTMFKMGKHL
jgi:hypothetical protein